MTGTGTATTRHTCGGPAFGRLTPGCPRCDELTAGAAPRAGWTGTRTPRARPSADARRALDSHFSGERHRSGGCGPVCTFGDH